MYPLTNLYKEDILDILWRVERNSNFKLICRDLIEGS